MCYYVTEMALNLSFGVEFSICHFFLPRLKFSVLCADAKQAVAANSQLQQIAWAMYSNPPIQGLLLVSTILSDLDSRDQGALGQRGEGNENFHMFFWSIFFPLPFGVGTNMYLY